MAAREEAATNPDAVAARLRLARALNAALSFRYGLNPNGGSLTLDNETEAAYLRALELAPEDVEIYVEYLLWLQLFPEPGAPVLQDNLLPTLERALELRRNRAEIHYHLGAARLQTGQLEGAVSAFLEAVRLKPDHMEAHYSLAQAYVKLGQKRVARATMARFRELQQNMAQQEEQIKL